MTTVAWDGKRLAADKRTNFGGLHAYTTKVREIRGHLVAGAGTVALINEMMEWFGRGAIPGELPDVQRDEDKSITMIVISPDGIPWRYDNGPFPSRIENPFWAIGSGRDFAMAAMHLGCTALEAVELASIYDINTGNGVDVLCLPNTTPD